MTRDEFNAFCGTLKATHHVVQWGGADVWKVGSAAKNKVFALCGWNDGHDAFTFKVSPMVFDLMGHAPGYRPAPYMASRGMTWLQIHDPGKVADADIQQHIEVSYELAVGALTRKLRAELGLEG